MGHVTPRYANEKPMYPGGGAALPHPFTKDGACPTALAALGVMPIMQSADGCGLFRAFSAGNNSRPAGTVSDNYGTGRRGKLTRRRDACMEGRLHASLESCLGTRTGGLYAALSGSLHDPVVDGAGAPQAKIPGSFPDTCEDTNAPPGISYQGYEQFFATVIDQLLTPLPVVRKRVNLFGIVPYRHPFWKDDLQVLKSLLEGIGLEVNMIFTENDGVQALMRIPSAELNLVFSPWSGVGAARKLEAKFDTPYTVISSLPIGPRDTSALLRFLARRLHLRRSRAERFISFQETRAARFTPYTSVASGLPPVSPRAAVVADAGTAIALTRYGCNELGWTPEIVVLTDDPPEEFRAEIVRSLTAGVESVVKPEVHFETDAGGIASLLSGHGSQLVLCSSLEQGFTRQKLDGVYVSIAYPVRGRQVVGRSYVGYRGGLTFVEDLAYRLAAAP